LLARSAAKGPDYVSESDANRAMTETARMRLLDPLEQTQPMPIHVRRERQREAVAHWQWREPFERLPDFRETPRAHLSALERAQQDGFPDNEY
jgi:hypothetical protein